jgi:hypothetical protein
VTLRITKRDGAFTDINASASTIQRFTRRDGTFADFGFASTGRVRVTWRDGSYRDLALAACPGGGAHQWYGSQYTCASCNASVEMCIKCGMARYAICPFCGGLNSANFI